MQKIVLLILLAVSSLVGVEKNSMDCSDTPDWLMSEADKKYLCKENNPNKKANIQNEWLKVSSTLCENNDGKIENGQCEATWEDAQKMCKTLDAQLPNIEDLSTACKSNTKDLDENIKDSEYQKCYKSQGFSSESYYWSSTVDEIDTGKSLAYYFYVGRTMAYRQNNWFYVKCLREKTKFNTVQEVKKKIKPVSVPKDNIQTGIVHSLDPNGDGFLSIRTKPKGREVGKLYNGDKVQILAKKGKYYKIKKMSNGQVGYAHSNWIRKTSSTATASNSSSSKSGVVTGLDPNGDGFLSLRSKPKGRQLGKLYNGDRLSILDKRGKWYKVKTASAGQVGWAYGHWIRRINHTVTTKKEALSLAENDCGNFKNLPLKYRKDKEVVLKALGTDFGDFTFEYADESLKRDKEFILTFLKKYEDGKFHALKWIDESLKNDEEIFYTACRKHGGALRYAGEELKKNKDLVLTALNQYFESIEYADESLKKDKSFALAAIDVRLSSFEYLDQSLKNDREFILSAIHANHFIFEKVDQKLQKDREFVLAAISQNHKVFEEIDKSFKGDRDFVLDAVKANGNILQYVDKTFRKDKEIVLAAVKQNGFALRYALVEDKEIALAAVQQNPMAFEWVKEALRSDPDIANIVQTYKEKIGSDKEGLKLIKRQIYGKWLAQKCSSYYYQHTQEGWKMLASSKDLFYQELKRLCPRANIRNRTKGLSSIYSFAYENAVDTGNIPSIW